MTFLVFLLIALGWVGWLWAWGRDRMLGGGPSLHMPSLQTGPRGPLAPPRTAAMARRRRREVLAALGLLVVSTFVLARAWSAMWAVHVLVDVAFLAYLWAVCSIERPDLLQSRPSFGPVVDHAPARPAPGPTRLVEESDEADDEMVTVLELDDSTLNGVLAR